ncbi:MAG: peptidyl-prolyl cis-trans isomerase [Lentisphaeria bacterium]|nr:peptidyl-prolyl cis-trans isomerase [Lentisphaeria bacterium]
MATQVLLETSEGNIKLELFEKEAPITVENFLRYVNEKHYDGTIFHRVIRGFMIQGGGMDFDLFQMPTHEPIKNEAGNGLSNLTGTIAMARTSVVDSATAQFFINVADNTFLDHKDETARGFGYCVFGKVIEGMEVVRKIEEVDTTSHGYHDDVPVDTITIKKASVV